MTQEEKAAGFIQETEKQSPVRIQKIRPVGVPDQDGKAIVFELQLQQDVATTTGNPLLSLTMSGDSRFTSKSSRVAWQNFSRSMIEAMNLPGIVPDELTREGHVFDPTNQNNPILEFKKPDGTLRNICLVEIDSFQPRSFGLGADGVERWQPAKTAGTGGELLTRDGKSIYRNVNLSMEGLLPDVETGRKWNEDFIIRHNNVVQGSNKRAADAAIASSKSGIGQIVLPGGATKVVNAEDVNNPNNSPTGTPQKIATGEGAGQGHLNQPNSTAGQSGFIDDKGNKQDAPPAGSAEDEKNKKEVKKKVTV